MKLACMLVLAVGACVELDDAPLEATTQAEQAAIVHGSTWYEVPWRGNTSWATVGYYDIDLGVVQAGTTVLASTCYAEGGYSVGTSYMRLWSGAVGVYKLQVLTEENVQCPYEPGVKLTTTLDRTQQVRLRVGCRANGYCGSRVVVQRVFDSNGRMTSVVDAFNAIPNWRNPTVDRGGFQKNGTLARTDDYHNQGITRVRVGNGEYANWLVMSRNHDARVYIAGFGTRSSALAERLAPNLYNGAPLSYDKVFATFALGTQAGGPAQGSHAGGMQAAGRFLYVPVEGESGHVFSQGNLYGDPRKSSVHLIDMSLGWDGPKLVPQYLDRPYGGASAVGITKVGAGSGRARDFLMIVGDRNSRDIDFYVNPADMYGFADVTRPWQHRLYWRARDAGTELVPRYVDDTGSTFHKYQSFTLVTQTNGAFYLLATGSTDDDEDVADLFRVDSSVYGPTRSAWCGKEFCLSKIATKTFVCRNSGGDYCSFHGAAGAYFATDANRIFVYSAEYYSSIADWQTFMEW